MVCSASELAVLVLASAAVPDDAAPPDTLAFALGDCTKEKYANKPPFFMVDLALHGGSKALGRFECSFSLALPARTASVS